LNTNFKEKSIIHRFVATGLKTCFYYYFFLLVPTLRVGMCYHAGRGNKNLKKICVHLCNLWIISFLFLMSGGVYGEEKDKNDSLLKGREIFHERCAACHGIDGNPILPEAPSFAKGERLDKTDKELLESIRHGKGDIMVPWEGVISDKEIKDVLEYSKVIVGDKVFNDKCIICHKKIPNMPAGIPEDKSLKGSSSTIRICKHCDIESTMTREEQIEVIRFIRRLKK